MQHRDITKVHHDRRTLRGEFNGEAAWTKYAVVPLRPLSSTAFNIFSRLTDLPIFRSTHNSDGRTALRAEAQRLRYLKERDFLVPEIFEQSDDHLVISDIGDCLETLIADSPDIASRRALFCRAASYMAMVHSSDEYHGRSVTKDLTVKGNRMGMIDLEHEPLRVMPLPDAQARDAWLIFLSAAKYSKNDKELIPTMLESYAGQAPVGAIDSLRRSTGALNLVAPILAFTLGAVHRNDTMAAMGHMNRELHYHLTR